MIVTQLRQLSVVAPGHQVATPIQLGGCKKFKMPIYTKSTILKLENSRKMLEIVFLCTLNMLNFKRLALIVTEM